MRKICLTDLFFRNQNAKFATSYLNQLYIMQTKRLTKSEKDALPKKGDKYYYIFSSMVSHRHEVREATFFNGISERMRIAKGNCYMTKAGAQVAGQNHFLRFAEALSPLGNADAASCGDLCAMLFSDFSRKVTMQNIYNDGGFSSTGMTDTFIRQAGDIF